MNPPRVTVLMPAYNASRHIREAIGSVLTQTYQDYELLIVDDGSTDSTREIVKSYDDERVRLVCLESNSGVAAALNSGLMSARADLIARLDADDIAYPQRLARQVTYMDAHPDCGLLGSSFDRIDEFGHVTDTVDLPCETAVIRWRLLTSNVVAHPSVMFRRSIALAVGGYDEDSYNSEDHALWAAMSPLTHAAALPERLIAYRDNPQGVSRTATRESGSIAVAQRQLARVSGRDVSLDVMRCLRGMPPVETRPHTACRQATSILAIALARMVASDDTTRGHELLLLRLWRSQAERLCDVAPSVFPFLVFETTRLSWEIAGVRGLGAQHATFIFRSFAFSARSLFRRVGRPQGTCQES